MNARERMENVLRNAERFTPQRLDDDLDTFDGFESAVSDDDGGLPFGSEQALAEAFTIEAADKLRWTPGMDWMVNTGPHWVRDEHLSRYTSAKQVCKAAASGLNSTKLAAKICAASTANALLMLARSAPGIVTPVGEWDKHPMLLNTPTHVIDLEAGRAVSRDGLLFTQADRKSVV